MRSPMNLLHNMTVNTLYSGDVLCPAELESESLPTKRVSKWPSMLFWIQGVLTIVKPLTHVCMQQKIIGIQIIIILKSDMQFQWHVEMKVF